MIYLKLFFEYFKIGLFAIGGGLATIPFLTKLSETSGWYTLSELADMVAIAESTPGPIGINVSTYVGYKVAGVFGSLCASFGLILPSFLVMLVIYYCLNTFYNNTNVQNALRGIRPASTALITSALFSLCCMSFVTDNIIDIKKIILGIILFALIYFVPKIKDVHPVILILFSAGIGIIFKL